MKKIFVIFPLLFLVFISGVSSQTVLLQEKGNDTIIPKRGPNYKNFSHFYAGFGFIAGMSENVGSAVNYEKSGNFILGYRYKFKLSNFYAVGYDIMFNTNSFSLRQNDKKIFPDTIKHDKENFNITNCGLGFYNRFNFGKRGNYIGKFLDLGAYGSFKISASNFFKDKRDNGNIVKTTILKLKYVETLDYGVIGRIGFNRYVFFATYRLSDLFKQAYAYPELPRITVGMQVSFHK